MAAILITEAWSFKQISTQTPLLEGSSTTTVLSKLLTSCLTAVKKHWIRYYDTVYERDGINYFWSIKNSNDVLNKFKSKNFRASKLSTYDFSTLYTTLPNHLIKDKLIDLINRTFIRVNTQYLACNEECAFFTSDVYNNHNLWSCQKVCDALVYLLDNIFIRFGTKLYRQTIGIPMGTNCAPLVADLFLFCYERDFMKSLSRENQADIIEAFFGSGKGCGLWLWHSLDFSLTFFSIQLQDTLTIYQILTIFTLTKWWTGYTLQNSN